MLKKYKPYNNIDLTGNGVYLDANEVITKLDDNPKRFNITDGDLTVGFDISEFINDKVESIKFKATYNDGDNDVNVDYYLRRTSSFDYLIAFSGIIQFASVSLLTELYKDTRDNDVFLAVTILALAE